MLYFLKHEIMYHKLIFVRKKVIVKYFSFKWIERKGFFHIRKDETAVQTFSDCLCKQKVGHVDPDSVL